MSDKVLSIKLQFTADGTPIIAQAGKVVDDLGKAADRTAQSAEALSGAGKDLVAGAQAIAAATSSEAAALAQLSSQLDKLTNLSLAQTRMQAVLVDQSQKTTAAIGDLSGAHRSSADAAGTATSALGVLEGALGSVMTAVTAVIGAWSFKKVVDEMVGMTMAGINFNAELQTSRLGIGALISTFGQLTDAQGHVLTGQDAYNAAMTVATDLQDKLKIRALATTLQYSQLLNVLQRGMPYMLAAFKDKDGNVVSNDKLVDFTATFAQGAVTAGLAPEEVGVNIQRFLTGTADPRHARFAAQLLQTIAPTQEAAREQMQEWEQQGVLMDKVMEKLQAFKRVGEDAMNTYSGALSNLKDAWQQLLGEGTSDATGVFTDAMLKIRDVLVTVDQSGHSAFNPELVTAIKTVADTIASLVAGATKLATAFAEPGGIIDTTKTFVGQLGTMADKLNAIPDWFIKGALGATPAEMQKQADAAAGAGPVQAYKNWWTGNASAAWDKWSSLVSVGPNAQYDSSAFYVPSNVGDAGIIAANSTFQNAPLPKIKGPHMPGEEPEDLSKTLASFDRWMEEFHFGAKDTGDDAIATRLRDIERQRTQAIDKLNEAEKDLAKTNENFRKDLDDINATFTNRSNDALGKYGDEVRNNLLPWSAKWAASAQQSPDQNPEDDVFTKNFIDRQAALADLEKRKRANPELYHDWEGDAADINKDFDTKLVNASEDGLKKVTDNTIKQTKSLWDMKQQMDLEAQQAIDDQQIAMITDVAERELAIKNREIDRWAADQKAKIELTYAGNTEAEKKALDTLNQWVDQKKRLAKQEAELAEARETAGTEEWAADLAQKIDQAFKPIGVTLEDTIVSSLQAANAAAGDFFSKLADGQKNVGADLEQLGKNLGQQWGKVFGDMLTNAATGKQGLMEQFSQLKDAMDQMNPLQAGLAGAGIGAVVGGAFGGPNNKAGAGGAIGGAIGGIVGSIIPAIGTAVGSVVGSVLGSVIGSMLPTASGKNHIDVNFSNLTLDQLRGQGGLANTGDNGHDRELMFGAGSSLEIQQQGLSSQGLDDLIVQVQRQAKETMKGWQSIVDLFPDEVKKQLANFDPTLSLKGGIDDGGKEIGDTSALSKLSDFLNNKLPEAAFKAFTPELQKAFSLEGMSDTSIQNLFKYWGTLQGQELHDAVQSYVTSLVAFADIRKKLSSFDLTTLDVQKQESATPLTGLQDAVSQIGLVVASLPKLPDTEDQIAAMGKLNDLSTQFYNSMVQYLQQIDAVAKSINDQFAGTREQIQLTGMNNQQKIDYYYQQMAELRQQLAITTDPTKIQEITSKINAYAQQALGLAPDNAQNRDKLLKILSDIQGMADAQLDKAKNAVANEEQKAATMLQQAAQALLQAAGALNPSPPAGGGGGGRPGGGGPQYPNPDPTGPLVPGVNAFSSSLTAATAALDNLSKVVHIAIDGNSAGGGSGPGRLRPHSDGAGSRPTLRAEVSVPDKIVFDFGPTLGVYEEEIVRRIQLSMRVNPDYGHSRSS